MAEKTDDLIDISALAKVLGRAEHTIRSWIREGDLPKRLQPKRVGGRQKIYWNPGQVAGLKAYADKRKARRGWQH